MFYVAHSPSSLLPPTCSFQTGRNPVSTTPLPVSCLGVLTPVCFGSPLPHMSPELPNTCLPCGTLNDSQFPGCLVSPQLPSVPITHRTHPHASTECTPMLPQDAPPCSHRMHPMLPQNTPPWSHRMHPHTPTECTPKLPQLLRASGNHSSIPTTST